MKIYVLATLSVKLGAHVRGIVASENPCISPSLVSCPSLYVMFYTQLQRQSISLILKLFIIRRISRNAVVIFSGFPQLCIINSSHSTPDISSPALRIYSLFCVPILDCSHTHGPFFNRLDIIYLQIPSDPKSIYEAKEVLVIYNFRAYRQLSSHGRLAGINSLCSRYCFRSTVKGSEARNWTSLFRCLLHETIG